MSTGPRNKEIRILFKQELESTRDSLLALIDPRLSYFINTDKLFEMTGATDPAIKPLMSKDVEFTDADVNLIWGRFNNKKRKRQLLHKISAVQNDPRISIFLNEQNNPFSIITAFIRAHQSLRNQDNELSRRR